jgi:hypothetical protein
MVGWGLSTLQIARGAKMTPYAETSVVRNQMKLVGKGTASIPEHDAE